MSDLFSLRRDETETALLWHQDGPGEWSLYDRPRGRPRAAIARVTGLAAIGFHVTFRGNGGASSGKFGSVPAAKRAAEALARRATAATA